MNKILVLGIGSRLMMDDGIGICIVEDLKNIQVNPSIKYITGENDVDYCLTEVLGSDYVIIIDAFLSGKHPGEITAVPLTYLGEENNDSCYSLHGMHLINVLKCTKKIPKGILIGIEPCVINFGFNLSKKLQSCYSNILISVYEKVNEYIRLCEGVPD